MHFQRAHQIAISTPSTPEENALSDSGIETPDTSAANLSPGKSRNVNIAVKPARKYAEIEGPDDLLSDSDEEKELQTDPPEEQHVEAASPTKRGLKTSKHQCSKCSYVSDINNLLQHEEVRNLLFFNFAKRVVEDLYFNFLYFSEGSR